VGHKLKLFENLPGPLGLLYLQNYHHLDPRGTQVSQMQWPPQVLPESTQLYLQLSRCHCMMDELLYSRPRQGSKLFCGDTINLHLCMNHVVDITTRYGLDVPGIEFWWGHDFLHPPSSALGPTQPPIKCVLGLFPGRKGVGAWRLSVTPHLAPRLKK
jgi:hypothetical protein